MIIVMRPDAEKCQVDAILAQVKEKGLRPVLLEGTERRVIAVIGDERKLSLEHFAAMPGVENAIPVLAPYKLASKEGHLTRTVVRAHGLEFGGVNLGLVAGPCTLFKYEVAIETAKAVKAAGATAFRGGAFKPRSSPYSFQGAGEEGLEILRAVRQETGLAVITEVMALSQVAKVDAVADVLQIGTRNMANYNLLEAVGECGKPVLLKRGMSATLEEWLLAAEYIMAAGKHEAVILCERGIRTFEDHTRNTLSLSVIPAIREKSHLPVVVDPSHGTGKRAYVAAMSKASIAAGADGLLLEVEPRPEEAVADAAQTISTEAFAELLRELAPIAKAVGKHIALP